MWWTWRRFWFAVEVTILTSDWAGRLCGCGGGQFIAVNSFHKRGMTSSRSALSMGLAICLAIMEPTQSNATRPKRYTKRLLPTLGTLSSVGRNFTLPIPCWREIKIFFFRRSWKYEVCFWFARIFVRTCLQITCHLIFAYTRVTMHFSTLKYLR